jgi:hypothetical protein
MGKPCIFRVGSQARDNKNQTPQSGKPLLFFRISLGKKRKLLPLFGRIIHGIQTTATTTITTTKNRALCPKIQCFSYLHLKGIMLE